MKPLRFRAWLVLEPTGEPSWHDADIWTSTPRRPRVYLDRNEIKLTEGQRLEEVEVAITPVAKRCEVQP